MMKGDTKLTLQVGACMVRSPHTIGVDQPLSRAAEQMAEHGIRHLPVLEGGRLVGLLSERDIALVESTVPAGLDAITVEDAMAGVPYCVEADAPVGRVAQDMALRKLGSAIVTDRGKIVGVFTTTDALQVLCQVLETGVVPFEEPEPEPEPDEAKAANG